MKQMIDKLKSVTSSTSSTPTFVTLLDDFNESMEEVRVVIPQYEDHEFNLTFTKGIIQEDMLIHYEPTTTKVDTTSRGQDLQGIVATL